MEKLKRKIVKLGPSTLVVSLPSKWVKKFDIKVGDELDLEERNDCLLLNTSKQFNIDKVKLDFSPYSKLMKRTVTAKYVQGCDEIEVFVDTIEKSRDVQRRVDQLIGMEVISQTKNKLLIKDIQGAANESFDNILRRVFFLLDSQSDELLKILKKKKYDGEYLWQTHRSILKFSDYCLRLLNKQGHSDYKQTSVVYCIVFLLKRISEDYRALFTYCMKNELNLRKEIVNIYGRINSYQKDMQSLYLKFDMEKAVALSLQRDEIAKEIDAQLADPKSLPEVVVLKSLESLTNNIIFVMNQLQNIY